MDPDAASWPSSRLGYRSADRLVELMESAAQPTGVGEIAGYEIVHRLGSGGTGEVFLGRTPGMGRNVVIKVLHPGASTTGQSQLIRELKAASALRLECMPRLLDSGVDAGRVYLVFEHIEGLTLDTWAMDRRHDDRVRAKLLARLCLAVHSLHEHGIIHRDLKPSNLLVQADGQVSIIDLGVAHIVADQGAELTFPGVPVGSPLFMAPEQARGDHAAVSTRSDVFALGLIALVVLTGRNPRACGGGLADEVRRAADEPIPDPRQLRPDLPRPLSAIIGKACEQAPARRYASAAACAEEFERYLAGEPVEAQPLGPFRRAARWIVRHPIVFTWVASLAIAGGIVGGTAWVTWLRQTTPASLEIVGERVSARVRAVDGSILATVGSGQRDSVRIAELVDRPARLGGGRVLVGMWHDQGRRNPVRVVDPADPSRVLWTAPTIAETPGLFPAKLGPRMELLGLTAIVADMLPDPPGEEGTPEIAQVLVHTNFSPCVLRVYDLAGNLRYEAWHDGWIHSLYWLPAAPGNAVARGTLFACGVSDHAELRDGPMSVGGVPFGRYAVCVMGLDVAVQLASPRSDAKMISPLSSAVIDPPLQSTGSDLPRASDSPANLAIWLAERALPAASSASVPDTGLKWYRFLQPWSASKWIGESQVHPAKEPELRDSAVRLVMPCAPRLMEHAQEPRDAWLTLAADGRVLSGWVAKDSPLNR